MRREAVRLPDDVAHRRERNDFWAVWVRGPLGDAAVSAQDRAPGDFAAARASEQHLESTEGIGEGVKGGVHASFCHHGPAP